MFLFNPDNDLALANFSTNYTPPASALKIAGDLAALPLWYAPQNSMVVAEGLHSELFLSRMQKNFPIRSSLISFSDISQFPKEKINPWGWNPALKKRLTDVGVREENLPSGEYLQLLRDYSGRQNAVRMLREAKELRTNFCGESHLFSTLEDVLHFLSVTQGNKVLKMPNSGSGKGLVWILGEITDKQTDWCRRVIREQGGIIAEPVLEKVQDFAMEFFCENGNVSFSGYSLFKSAASGAYLGNFLLSNADIEKKLSKLVFIESLHWLKAFYLKKLIEYFPHYNGYIGVDMMICQTEKGYQIQPCVEMNVRMNMGMVARIFHDKFVHFDSSGKFVVDYFKKREEALGFQQKMQKDFPLVVDNGRIKSGFLNLTAVSQETNYVAWVLIGTNDFLQWADAV